MKSKEENMVSQNNWKVGQWMQNGASWEIQNPKLNMELVQKNWNPKFHLTIDENGKLRIIQKVQKVGQWMILGKWR
jgi:hypothetical protein